ncbi:hypothetical protein GKE82_03695 [Conexibacter sp. W3-3-2]|uniref:hypothetical protein n=1 Tax=Conexibacter sp. W3-3-2 TaxID=2675227 RepID=UPI0012B7F137|nr:hypothetical protein [Conexibacter sp. W3-3-2]MTD43428.1 hypothetical protein [Conexibacter sp. W3-3-2]
MTEPQRFKPMDDWTVDEHLEHERTGRQPETDEYRAAMRQHIEEHGTPFGGTGFLEATVEDHLDYIRRNKETR